MSTLWELTADYQVLLQMAEDPDVDQQTLQDTLEGVGGEIEIKADGYARVLANMEIKAEELLAKANVFQMEADRLKDMAKRVELNGNRMKESLKRSMEETGKVKFKTDFFSFNIAKNPPKLIIDNKAKVPKKYLIPQEPKIDNAAIKKDIKEKPVKWAHLEQTTRLDIK